MAAYIREIDVLRCLAVSSVVAFHYGAPGAEAGWAGVWLFYVVSGFVITRSLESTPSSLGLGHYLKSFYARRVFRILPLYLAVVLAGCALFASVLPWEVVAKICAHLLTFTYNFFRATQPEVALRMFAHLWSLSVEEQFYLFYPFLLFFIRGKRARITMLLAAVAVSPVIRAVTASSFPTWDPGEALYFLSFTQIDGFALGGLAAVLEPDLRRDPKRSLRLALGCIGAFGAYYLATWLAMASTFGWRPAVFERAALGYGREIFSYSALNLLSFGLVVIAVSRPQTLRWLANRVTVEAGRISYGIYIFHFPVLWAFAKYVRPLGLSPGPMDFTLYVAVVLLMAWGSFHFFEQPIRLWGQRFSKSRHPTPQRLEPNPVSQSVK